MSAPTLAQHFAQSLCVPSSSSLSVRHSRFAGTSVGVCHVSASRVTCAVTLLPPSTARVDLLDKVEQRWLKAHDSMEKEDILFTFEDFSEALSLYDFDFSAGQVVKGVVFGTDSSGVMVDIGAKGPAYLPLKEASIYKVKDMNQVGLYPGAMDEFLIINEKDNAGRLIISLKALQMQSSWERARQLLAEDATVFGKVLAVNRGGLLVEVEGLRGFVPMSLLALRNKDDIVDTELALKYLEVDEERMRLVLSNRKAVTENQVQGYSVGDVIEGTVQAVKPYGAFVDIGGINGLLHISQISHDRITNVETVLQEGDRLKVMILSHDRAKGRLSLSTKKLEPTPGDMIRNPQLVYEKADEMANTFRERVAAAEAASRLEEKRLQEEGYNFAAALTGATVDKSTFPTGSPLEL